MEGDLRQNDKIQYFFYQGSRKIEREFLEEIDDYNFCKTSKISLKFVEAKSVVDRTIIREKKLKVYIITFYKDFK